MAQLLKLATSVYTATGTCAPDALDEQLQDLLDNFDKTHPEAYIDSAEHQVVVLPSPPKLLVSLLVNFSYAQGLNNELHPAVQHLTRVPRPGEQPAPVETPTEADPNNPLQ